LSQSLAYRQIVTETVYFDIYLFHVCSEQFENRMISGIIIPANCLLQLLPFLPLQRSSLAVSCCTQQCEQQIRQHAPHVARWQPEYPPQQDS